MITRSRTRRRAARTAFPVAKGIRLLGISLSSLAVEEAEREPEFSLPALASGSQLESSLTGNRFNKAWVIILRVSDPRVYRPGRGCEDHRHPVVQLSAEFVRSIVMMAKLRIHSPAGERQLFRRPASAISCRWRDRSRRAAPPSRSFSIPRLAITRSISALEEEPDGALG